MFKAWKDAAGGQKKAVEASYWNDRASTEGVMPANMTCAFHCSFL